MSVLMGAGFASWWRTRDWWTQALLWTFILNGSLAVAIWGDESGGVDVFILFGVMTMFAAIAVAIIMQEAIVGERRSGTAAWVLSKPASREAFMLSKLVPNAVGVLATMIVIPSTVLVLQMSLAGIEVSVPRFALGALVAALNLMFFLTLTLMLGTLFESAGPVIAIPLAFAFGQQLDHRDSGSGLGAAVGTGRERRRFGQLGDERGHHRCADRGAGRLVVARRGVRGVHPGRVLEVEPHRAVTGGLPDWPAAAGSVAGTVGWSAY